MGESSSADRSVEECFKEPISPRLVREALERPLLPERTEAASFDSVFVKIVEFLGLSVLLLLPGIFDRKERKDLEDSLVSDLLNDGYDCRSPEPALGEDPPSLELWLPIGTRKRMRQLYEEMSRTGRGVVWCVSSG